MAKRKRLSPATTGFLDEGPRPAAPFAPAPIAGVAGDAATAAAAEELARTLSKARIGGRMVLELPLDRIDAGYLVRDRLTADEAEMQVLMASIAARGQQAPIEVVDFGDGTYGLISGWRRLEALRRLGPEGGPNMVLALLRQPHEASEAYLSMVEENEIRVGLSYYERARIALKAVEHEAYPDIKAALLGLYHAASRAKRSKIGSFLGLVAELDGTLAFPEALGERAGLRLARALGEDPTLAYRLRERLEAARPADPQAELAVIEAAIAPPKARRKAPAEPPRKPQAGARNTTPLPLYDGIFYSETEDGSVMISGPGVTQELRERIIDWLMLGDLRR